MKTTSGSATRLAREVKQAALCAGAVRTLLLDVDGTLAPTVDRPADALVEPSVSQSLAGLLADRWGVVLISGRPAAEVVRLVPLSGVRVYGSHGLEGPNVENGPASTRVSRRLQAIVAGLGSLVRQFPGARVEVKPFGVAFHDRGLSGRVLAAWRARVQSLLLASDLEGLTVQTGRRVIELRPAHFHKGLAAREVLSALRPSGFDASLVALGDDTTDEDMFLEVREWGLTVRVGRARRPTWAERSLASPDDVAAFLQQLVGATGDSRARERACGGMLWSARP
jgi:trehalose-phosphatase